MAASAATTLHVAMPKRTMIYTQDGRSSESGILQFYASAPECSNASWTPEATMRCSMHFMLYTDTGCSQLSLTICWMATHKSIKRAPGTWRR